MTQKFMTKGGVSNMITARLRRFKDEQVEAPSTNGHLPILDFEKLSTLEEGHSALVRLHRHQVSPSEPIRDELREYRRVDGRLYHREWKGA